VAELQTVKVNGMQRCYGSDGARVMAQITLHMFGSLTVVYTLPEAASFRVALLPMYNMSPSAPCDLAASLRRYFSYEHFYVIYCKFWELDSDHDFLIDKEDLLRYGNHALTYRIVDRIFAQVSSGCLWHSMLVLCLAHSTSALITGFRIRTCKFEHEEQNDKLFACGAS
jgi:hypothetical protein